MLNVAKPWLCELCQYQICAVAIKSTCANKSVLIYFLTCIFEGPIYLNKSAHCCSYDKEYK